MRRVDGWLMAVAECVAKKAHAELKYFRQLLAQRGEGRSVDSALGFGEGRGGGVSRRMVGTEDFQAAGVGETIE